MHCFFSHQGSCQVYAFMTSFAEIVQPKWYPDIVEFLTTQQLLGK
jgi:hypothetical protein